MSAEQNTRLVEDVYASYQRGDIAALLNQLTEDVSWFVPGPKEVVPFLGQRQGKDQVKQFFLLLADSQEPEQFEPRELIAQGDQVVSLGHYRWRVKSTGRKFEADFAHVFTVRNGKVAQFHEYTDTLAAVNAYTTGKAAGRS
jgi:ketosteroid isomerase-like protein